MFAIWGICKNSSRSRDPDPSLDETMDMISMSARVLDISFDVPVELHEAFLETLQLLRID